MQVVEEKHQIVDAFKIADDVLRQGVQGISDLIAIPGLVNLDFADVKTIMFERGLAHMGIGRASGDKRASEAAKQAIHSPLLETSINGSKGVLLNITGGANLGLYEVNEAAEIVSEAADTDANIIFGAVIDEALKDEIRITVIATGFESANFGEIFADNIINKVVNENVNKDLKEPVVVEEPVAVAPVPAPVQPQPKTADDLDIPTFLRRKR